MHVFQFDSFVRRFYDQGYKFFLTGSNAGLLQEEISTRLTGRHIDTFLKPFSFSEYLTLKNIPQNQDSPYITEERALIRQAFNEYLVRGGMPEYLIYQDEEIIRRNYEDIITRDIFLRKIVNRFDFSVSKQLVNDKKAYICDNAFIMNISTRVGIDNGWLLENLIAERLKAESGIFYYAGKRECDFITMKNRQIGLVCQVSWELIDLNRKREFDGLVEAMNHVGLKTGRILTYDQEEERKVEDKTIHITPVWKWLLENRS